MIADQKLPIAQYPFLDEQRCNDLVATLEERCDLALDRNPLNPGTFVTYGRAAYFDVCQPHSDPEQNYYRVIAASNRALQTALSDFYEELRLAVERLLGEPVGYEMDTLALPGVHIFRGKGIRSAGEGGFHFDVQYQKLNFPAPVDSGTMPISVTVPLRIPGSGTGLLVYDVTYEDYERAYRMGRITSLEQLVRRKTSSYYPYRLGNLILHRGLVVHSIATPGPIGADDERITVQCHGLRCAGKWILYW